MVRCHICDKQTSADIKITEKRYFWGEQNVCPDCFEHWIRFDFDYLDKKAIAKIEVKK